MTTVRLFFLGLLLSPVLILGADRAKNIPGIDPLPLATGEGSPNTQRPDTAQNTTNSTNQANPNDSNSTGNPQLDPADPGFPKVRNLTVAPEPSEPYAAKLSWQLYPDASTPVYVVRYSKPITNRALLLEAYNLTSPPLAAGTQVFLNRDMPEGVYYFAVVTAFELSRDGRLELRPGQNYTVAPFVVYRQDRTEPTKPNDTQTNPDATQSGRDPNLLPSDFYIKSLSALDSEKGVVLNWPGLPLRGLEYEIFRSAEPIDSAERIDRAVSLGKVREDTPFYTDEGAIVGQRMYYGVAVRDTLTGKVYRDLKYQSSYIEHTFRRPVLEVKYDSFLPESLTAYLAAADIIQLIWIDPGPAVKEYRVYRNTIPITSAEILSQSKELGMASPGSGGFRDEGLLAGTYYYALLPITTSGELLSVFKPGRTFTMFGVTLRGPRVDSGLTEPTKSDTDATQPVDETNEATPESVISGFEISLQGSDVRLNWKADGDVSSRRVQVFRAAEPLDDPAELRAQADLVGDYAVADGSAIDVHPKPGDHYYSLLEYDSRTKAAIAVFFSRKPLTITGPAVVTESAADRLEKILSGAFMDARYAEAEEQLSAYLAEGDLAAALRSKALFYLGVVKIRLQKYEEARQIFLDPVAQAHDRERALFWYRISLERMKR